MKPKENRQQDGGGGEGGGEQEEIDFERTLKVGSVVIASETSSRLDLFLAKSFPGTSRRQARLACIRGAVSLNGRVYPPSGLAVQVGDRIEIVAAAPVRPRPATESVQILFENELVIVVDKPRLMPCVRLRDDDPPTVADFLARHEPRCRAASPDRREGGLIHRLDTSTSGVLIGAKTRSAWEELTRALRTEQISKQYIALVSGVLPRSVSGEPLVIDWPIAVTRDAKSVSVLTAESGAGRGEEPRARSGTRTLDARSNVVALKRFARHSLVEITAPRARRHQVRAHLAAAGHPLSGDVLYGSCETLQEAFVELRPESRMATQLSGGFLLHASWTRFRLPESEEVVECRSVSPYVEELLGE